MKRINHCMLYFIKRNHKRFFLLNVSPIYKGVTWFVHMHINDAETDHMLFQPIKTDHLYHVMNNKIRNYYYSCQGKRPNNNMKCPVAL